MILAGAPRTAGEVELEIRIARGRARDRFARALRKRGPTKIRVNEDARRVQDASQRRLKPIPRPRDQVDVFARSGEQLSATREQLGTGDHPRQSIDRRERP
jgi:hypothetical protein